MTPPYSPPNRGEDFILRIMLQDFAIPGSFKSSPTLASGDFKVDKDGGGLNNLNTLPSVDPTSTPWVKVTLSATEMTADVVSVQCIDQTNPKEWNDYAFCILTSGTGAYNPPIKGEALVLRVALADLATPGSYKSNPTIAAGDFKVDKDGAGVGNLNTLPSVDPSSTIWVKITLSATEMDADVVSVYAIDQTATKEWGDLSFTIQTVAAS